jgi:hypothetical protein
LTTASFGIPVGQVPSQRCRDIGRYRQGSFDLLNALGALLSLAVTIGLQALQLVS